MVREVADVVTDKGLAYLGSTLRLISTEHTRPLVIPSPLVVVISSCKTIRCSFLPRLTDPLTLDDIFCNHVM